MSSSETKKRVAHCSRCKNHDITVPLKGHKRYCRFADCECPRCGLTEQKQRVMAQHIALRRQQQLEREMGPVAESERVAFVPSPTAQETADRSLRLEEYPEAKRRHVSGQLQAAQYAEAPLASESLSYRSLGERPYHDLPDLVEAGCRVYNRSSPPTYAPASPCASSSSTGPDSYVDQPRPRMFVRPSETPTVVSTYHESWHENAHYVADSSSSVRAPNPVDLTRSKPPPTPALDLRKSTTAERQKLEVLLSFKQELGLDDSALLLLTIVAENAHWNRDTILKQLGRAEKTIEDLGLWPGKQ